MDYKERGNVSSNMWILWRRRDSSGNQLCEVDSIHDMWCKRCGPKKEWLDRKVAVGRK